MLKSIKCSFCGASTYDEEAQFCDVCGTRIRENVQVPKIKSAPLISDVQPPVHTQQPAPVQQSEKIAANSEKPGKALSCARWVLTVIYLFFGLMILVGTGGVFGFFIILIGAFVCSPLSWNINALRNNSLCIILSFVIFIIGIMIGLLSSV